jgi:hypothetical protein
MASRLFWLGLAQKDWAFSKTLSARRSLCPGQGDRPPPVEGGFHNIILGDLFRAFELGDGQLRVFEADVNAGELDVVKSRVLLRGLERRQGGGSLVSSAAGAAS